MSRLSKPERPFYINGEELRKLEDLAVKNGNRELWQVIDHMASTGARLEDAIEAVGSGKVTEKQVTDFMQTAQLLGHKTPVPVTTEGGQ